MGFWKTLGKIGLKVAPYAAMAIPGVGVPLGMALAGGISAADKKVSGGSWKDALLSGGISAGLSGVGAGALKGIGPTSGVASKMLKSAAEGGKGLGWSGAVGQALGDIGKNAATSRLGGMPQPVNAPEPAPMPQMPQSQPQAPSMFQPPQQSSLANSIFAGQNAANQRRRLAF